MKRKKRLKKGIESLKEQVKVYEEKLKKAREAGLKEFEEYYKRDIARLEGVKEKKEEQLDK